MKSPNIEIENKELINEKKLSLRVEFENNLIVIKDELILNGNYIYIEKFVNCYANDYDIHKVTKLQDLLKYKGSEIEYEYLNKLISQELELQSLKRLKKYITFNKPSNLEEYVKNFIDLLGLYYEDQIPLFKKILEEEKIQFKPEQINFIISEINKKKKIETFEKELMADRLGFAFISIEDLDELDGYQFEMILKFLFKNMGYKVHQTPQSGDQGADLILEKFGERTVVQAKRYNGKVSNKAVQEIAASKAHYNAKNGMVVTNSTFTNFAIELAKSNRIELVNRIELKKWLEQYPVNKNLEN